MKKSLLISILALAFATVSSAQEQTDSVERSPSSEAPTAIGIPDSTLIAQNKRPTTRRAAPARPAARRQAGPMTARQQLQRALALAKQGQYQAAATNLYTLARRPELQNERPQIKYILGIMLMEMKLNQVAAFQFVDVIRSKNPRYMKQAVEKLSIVADILGDDTLLNYAMGRMNVSDLPAANRDMISFRIGEMRLKSKDFRGAEAAFSNVANGSTYYNQAVYNRGLASLEQNKPDEALAAFQTLLALRARAPVTDRNKVVAQLSIARALYQKKEWDQAIEAYSMVPRDTIQWHDALFEQSWAMLRSARFRSALSNFQSLHSSYYEEFYIPESLLLRAIVYLYICKYDEMEKVLQLFEKTYGPVSSKVKGYLDSNASASAYYAEIEKASQHRKGQVVKFNLPIIVLSNILNQGNVRRSMGYLTSLDDERARIEANFPFKSSALGQYSVKLISTRRNNTTNAVGEMVKAHLANMRVELRDLYEQAGFIRYEMINGKKEALKKKLVGKKVDEAVDENVSRSFYAENGYDYYPFQGEFWLDEIGNYHYLGQSSCE